MQSLPLFQQNKKKLHKKNIPDNAEHSPEGVGQTVVKIAADEGKKAAEELWREILGIKKKAQDMMPGVDYALKGSHEAAKQGNEQGRAPIDYVGEILRPQEHNKEARESEQRVTQLVSELQKLAKSVKQVERTMVLQAVGPNKIQAGKYYESFFEWMLLFLQDTRKKVDNSSAWLSAMNGKSKRKQYVGKVKTSMNLFMSGERTAQNQTG